MPFRDPNCGKKKACFGTTYRIQINFLSFHFFVPDESVGPRLGVAAQGRQQRQSSYRIEGQRYVSKPLYPIGARSGL